MVLGGLLIGLSDTDEFALAKGVRSSLEGAVVRAVNVALSERDEVGGECVALVANHAFPHLGDWERGQVDYDVSGYQAIKETGKGG